jgi:hypothetical protein
MNCPLCFKPCTEKKGKLRRDASVLVQAIHDDGSPSHLYDEWPSVDTFLHRKYPGDTKRRMYEK